MSKKLTVIIPFLNEGMEVAHTVASIRQYAADRVEILVINDASNHLYDYEEMLKPYSATYLRNEERLGIAACRDLGVSLIQTPYFLFLDAHMRFYREDWGPCCQKQLETTPDNFRRFCQNATRQYNPR